VGKLLELLEIAMRDVVILAIPEYLLRCELGSPIACLELYACLAGAS